MRSLFPIAILLIVSSLDAQTERHTGITAPAVEIQTMSESCYGENSGSAYIQSASTGWNVDIYRNGNLLNTLTVANRDTFIHGLAIGCYTFVYKANDGSTETISKIISAPSKIISLCRVDYLDRANEDAVAFVNLSSGAVKFDWDFGDGGEHSAEISPVHTYDAPGTYTVTLTAYNSNGCVSVSAYTITISPDDRTGMNENGPQESKNSSLK